ncbi:MAG: hypothetical protein R2789_03805 [Microthrixaceae bacterium]
MLEAGEDARFVARRLVMAASEDVGLADPSGLLVAEAAARCGGVRRATGGPDQPRARNRAPGTGSQVEQRLCRVGPCGGAGPVGARG